MKRQQREKKRYFNHAKAPIERKNVWGRRKRWEKKQQHKNKINVTTAESFTEHTYFSIESHTHHGYMQNKHNWHFLRDKKQQTKSPGYFYKAMRIINFYFHFALSYVQVYRVQWLLRCLNGKTHKCFRSASLLNVIVSCWVTFTHQPERETARSWRIHFFYPYLPLFKYSHIVVIIAFHAWME